MAEIAFEAFLSASFQFLLGKIDSSRSYFAEFLWEKENCDVDELREKLELVLNTVSAELEGAEQKQLRGDQSVEKWIDKLQEAIFEVDDLLDEIDTDALQHEAVEAKSKPIMSSIWELFSPSTSSNDPDLESKIKKILTRLETIAAHRSVLDLKEGVGRNPSWRSTTSLIDDSEVYGRDEERKALKEMLLSDECGSGKIGVIPIVGMGGLGKTTLAQAVYNDDEVKNHFEVRAWVCVSEEKDGCKVLKMLHEAITLGKCDLEGLNVLQLKIQEMLNGKKFLIVLDDIWNEDRDFWEKMRVLFKAGAQGSKIIVTSRSEIVARIMGNVPIHHLQKLEEEACLKLFEKHAYGCEDFEANPDLKRIGIEIVKKCKGLPLAVKALGGLLSSTSDVEGWKRIAESNILALPDEGNDILPALRLSYYYLPSHLKKCFAYCAMFPKDYLFEKEELIRLWMAENLLKCSGGNRRMEEVGDTYFKDLESRSFFQPSMSEFKPSSYVMHDLMVDLAKSISGKYCCLLSKEENSNGIEKKTRYLAYDDPNDVRFNHVFEATRLRTLLSVGYSYSTYSEEVVRNLLLKLKCLRVLSFPHSKISELSDSIGELKHLRYLDLSWTNVMMLPESITVLYNLQTLKLEHCFNLEKLPKDMHNLINLRYLDVGGCDKLEEMPRKVSKLKNLQMLSTFIMGKDSGAKIGELGELSELRGELFIKNLENVGNVEDASDQANLKDKKHLAKLRLGWNNNCTLDESTHARDVLEMLVPNATLKELVISDYPGTVFPNWVGQCNIVFLELRGCSKCPSLPPLGQLASLKTLIISKFEAVVNVGFEFYGSARNPFPSLEILKFDDMPSWEQWNPIEVQDPEFFSNLRELGINSCYKLSLRLPHFLPSLTKLEVSWSSFYSRFRIMPQPWTCNELTLSLPRFLPSLTKFEVSSLKFSSPLPIMPRVHELYIKGCESLVLQEKSSSEALYHSLERLSIGYCRDSFRSVSMDFFPNLKTLGIAGCDSFESLCVSDGQSLCHSLEKVEIRRCRDSFRSVSMDFFPNLKTLKIFGCDSFESLCVSDGQSLCHSLEKVEITRCGDSFRSVSMDFFPNLKTLRIEECDSFESLCVSDGQSLCHSLEKVEIRRCRDSFRSVSMDFFPNLKTLLIRGCDSFESLCVSDGQSLSSLSSLQIFNCPNFVSFPKGGLPAPNLTSLVVNSKKLKRLPEKMHELLTSLQTLDISGCTDIETFPEGGLPLSLTKLWISSCYKLIALWSNLQTPPNLETLVFKGDEVAESFPEERLLPATVVTITTLRISGFKKLRALYTNRLQQFTSLKTLYISCCTKLQTLPEQGFSVSLKKLTIDSCYELQTLPEQGLPTSLRYLSIDKCPQLEKLCRRDGQYWSKIHHINKIEINGEDIKSETSTSN